MTRIALGLLLLIGVMLGCGSDDACGDDPCCNTQRLIEGPCASEAP